MSYFVTGATGFLGRFLVESLLQRGKGTIYVLDCMQVQRKRDDGGCEGFVCHKDHVP